MSKQAAPSAPVQGLGLHAMLKRPAPPVPAPVQGVGLGAMLARPAPPVPVPAHGVGLSAMLARPAPPVPAHGVGLSAMLERPAPPPPPAPVPARGLGLSAMLGGAPRPPSTAPLPSAPANAVVSAAVNEHAGSAIFGGAATPTPAVKPLPVPETPLGALPIVLVSCSDTKADVPKAKRIPAEQLYTSPLFKKSLAYARALTTEERIRILSAYYGVLRTSDLVTTYDLPIHKLSVRERDEWGERAGRDLKGAFGSAPAEVVILAGVEYVNALRHVNNRYRTDRVPWILTLPFGDETGERMSIGQRMHWLDEQIRARASAPSPSPSPELERARSLAYLRDQASVAPDTMTGKQIGAVLNAAAHTIERGVLHPQATGAAMRADAVRHLRAVAAKTAGTPAEAIHQTAREIENGEHHRTRLAPPVSSVPACAAGASEAASDLTVRARAIDVGPGLRIVFDRHELGDESPLWEGRIFWNGESVGSFRNDGRGGETIIQPPRVVEAFQAAVDAAAPEVHPADFFERESLVLTFAEAKLFDPAATALTLANVVREQAHALAPRRAPASPVRRAQPVPAPSPPLPTEPTAARAGATGPAAPGEHAAGGGGLAALLGGGGAPSIETWTPPTQALQALPADRAAPLGAELATIFRILAADIEGRFGPGTHRAQTDRVRRAADSAESGRLVEALTFGLLKQSEELEPLRKQAEQRAHQAIEAALALPHAQPSSAEGLATLLQGGAATPVSSGSPLASAEEPAAAPPASVRPASSNREPASSGRPPASHRGHPSPTGFAETFTAAPQDVVAPVPEPQPAAGEDAWPREAIEALPPDLAKELGLGLATVFEEAAAAFAARVDPITADAGASRLRRAANDATAGRLHDALAWGLMTSSNEQTRMQVEPLRREAEERARAWVTVIVAEAKQRAIGRPTPGAAPPSERAPIPVAAPPGAASTVGAGESAALFPEGSYVAVQAGRWMSRTGMVLRAPAGTPPEQRYVRLDKKGRERNDKNELVAVADLEPILGWRGASPPPGAAVDQAPNESAPMPFAQGDFVKVAQVSLGKGKEKKTWKNRVGAVMRAYPSTPDTRLVTFEAKKGEESAPLAVVPVADLSPIGSWRAVADLKPGTRFWMLRGQGAMVGRVVAMADPGMHILWLRIDNIEDPENGELEPHVIDFKTIVEREADRVRIRNASTVIELIFAEPAAPLSVTTGREQLKDARSLKDSDQRAALRVAMTYLLQDARSDQRDAVEALTDEQEGGPEVTAETLRRARAALAAADLRLADVSAMAEAKTLHALTPDWLRRMSALAAHEAEFRRPETQREPLEVLAEALREAEEVAFGVSSAQFGLFEKRPIAAEAPAAAAAPVEPIRSNDTDDVDGGWGAIGHGVRVPRPPPAEPPSTFDEPGPETVRSVDEGWEPSPAPVPTAEDLHRSAEAARQLATGQKAAFAFTQLADDEEEGNVAPAERAERLQRAAQLLADAESHDATIRARVVRFLREKSAEAERLGSVGEKVARALGRLATTIESQHLPSRERVERLRKASLGLYSDPGAEVVFAKRSGDRIDLQDEYNQWIDPADHAAIAWEDRSASEREVIELVRRAGYDDGFGIELWASGRRAEDVARAREMPPGDRGSLAQLAAQWGFTRTTALPAAASVRAPASAPAPLGEILSRRGDLLVRINVGGPGVVVTHEATGTVLRYFHDPKDASRWATTAASAELRPALEAYLRKEPGAEERLERLVTEVGARAAYPDGPHFHVDVDTLYVDQVFIDTAGRLAEHDVLPLYQGHRLESARASSRLRPAGSRLAWESGSGVPSPGDARVDGRAVRRDGRARARTQAGAPTAEDVPRRGGQALRRFGLPPRRPSPPRAWAPGSRRGGVHAGDPRRRGRVHSVRRSGELARQGGARPSASRDAPGGSRGASQGDGGRRDPGRRSRRRRTGAALSPPAGTPAGNRPEGPATRLASGRAGGGGRSV